MRKRDLADRTPESCDKENKYSSLKTEEEDRLFTTAEAAEFLRIPVSSLHTMTSNGQVPVLKLGRRNRYSLQDLRNLLWKNRRGGINGN